MRLADHADYKMDIQQLRIMTVIAMAGQSVEGPGQFSDALLLHRLGFLAADARSWGGEGLRSWEQTQAILVGLVDLGVLEVAE